MFQFLLVVHAIVAAALVTVILMQRSEGGGLGMGGSPSGLMSARGAADFLTRATTVLASLFVILAVVLAVLASTGHNVRIDPNLAKPPAGGLAPAPAPQPQPQGATFPGTQPAAPANGAAPSTGNGAVPIQH